MKGYTFSGAGIVQLVICCVPFGLPDSGLAATKTRFRLVQNFIIVVPVVINNNGPFEFLLDTGTTTTIVGRERYVLLNPVIADDTGAGKGQPQAKSMKRLPLNSRSSK